MWSEFHKNSDRLNENVNTLSVRMAHMAKQKQSRFPGNLCKQSSATQREDEKKIPSRQLFHIH